MDKETKTAKKKKPYCKPEMQTEEFTPNEYIAACWYIACWYGEQAPSQTGGVYYNNGDWGHTCSSDGSGCGHAKNQVIKGDLTNFTMYEENSGYKIPLECTNIQHQDSPLKEGSQITWETYNGKYKHMGYVHLENQSRPLHS